MTCVRIYMRVSGIWLLNELRETRVPRVVFNEGSYTLTYNFPETETLVAYGYRFGKISRECQFDHPITGTAGETVRIEVSVKDVATGEKVDLGLGRDEHIEVFEVTTGRLWLYDRWGRLSGARVPAYPIIERNPDE